MTMNAKSNTEMREILAGLLGESNPFSAKGLHYLACRMLGSKYKQPIATAINAMREGRLQKLVPQELKGCIAAAFGFEKEVPDPALIIIGTGRRPIKGKKGWDEAGYSLFNIPAPLSPEGLSDVKTKDREKIIKQYELRRNQKNCAEALMECFIEQAQTKIPEIEVSPPVEEVIVEKPIKPKKAKVVPIKKPETPPATEEPVAQTAPVKKPKSKKPPKMAD